MSLSNNYSFTDSTSGYPLRFVYLAYDGRLQVYLGRSNPLTGQFEPEYEYLDETQVQPETRAELKALAFAFAESGESPEEMEFR